MAQRRKVDLQLSLEVGFEPRRSGQEALADAYRRLLPTPSRPLRPTPKLQTKREASDAKPRDGFGTGAAGGPDPGGDLRQGVLRPAG